MWSSYLADVHQHTTQRNNVNFSESTHIYWRLCFSWDLYAYCIYNEYTYMRLPHIFGSHMGTLKTHGLHWMNTRRTMKSTSSASIQFYRAIYVWCSAICHMKFQCQVFLWIRFPNLPYFESLIREPDFNLWCPYAVTLHIYGEVECTGSEGGSC